MLITIAAARTATYAQFDKAIADHTEAIRLRPGYAHAFCDRAFAYAQIGKDDKVLSDYDKAVRLDPKDAIALCGAGRHLRCHGGATTRRSRIIRRLLHSMGGASLHTSGAEWPDAVLAIT